MGSDHRQVREVPLFGKGGKAAAKFKKRSPRTTINWDLYVSLAGHWEGTVMNNIDEEYDRFVSHPRNSAKRAESFSTTKGVWIWKLSR
ncbi:unnamed protein product [Heligmosomoides polygyrus]|uniref:DDE_Tnp_1_7 domain-containing protein n=1 Tax=Heligmosomoides polygyrus TaxID=6339 RepID=A0A183G7M9_HELPZ|nr:unnamed protein product [Heligmosomoides polygyrus]